MDIQNIFKYRLNIIIASAILFIVLDLIIETPLQNWLYFFNKNDKELFKRIYGEDYEKFKEVFEDTLKYVPILYSFMDLKDVKKTDDKPYAEFLRKYDNYTGDFDRYKIHDLLYIVLIQYSLIDENGHLVLPEDRKEEEE